MKSQIAPPNLTYCKDTRPCQTLSLLELAERIVAFGDREALKEFHDHRTPFQIRGGRPMNFAKYVDAIFRENWLRHSAADIPAVLERAQDMTMDKFTCITRKVRVSSNRCSYQRGIDCRNYFAAFVEYAHTTIDPDATRTERELQSARILQKFVIRHSYLSCLECKRLEHKLIRRYNWKVGTDVLVIWMPYEVPGAKCKSWLEENIPDVDPARPGERRRVQDIVDQLLTQRQIFSLDDLIESKNIPAPPGAVSSLLGEEFSEADLSQVVGREKTENISYQRPAIRKLGEGRLKKLIRRVFESLAGARYTEAQIAAEFNLSTATFSRFAGGRWSQNSEGIDPAHIPDLWRNTAHILANHPLFVDIVRETGVWSRICAIQGIQNPDGRGCHRE